MLGNLTIITQIANLFFLAKKFIALHISLVYIGCRNINQTHILMITVKQLQMQYRNIIEDSLNKMTQREASIICGVTEATIRNAVNKPHSVKIETLERIAKNLKEAL